MHFKLYKYVSVCLSHTENWIAQMSESDLKITEQLNV